MKGVIILEFRGKRTEVLYEANATGIVISGFGYGYNGPNINDVLTIQERNEILIAIMSQ
tara:strand:+ start:12417 stop:12593 length:177 start_codon:yes stop_codon:yes gene_type:complete